MKNLKRRTIQKEIIDNMVEVCEKIPDLINRMDDTFWELLDTSEKQNARRQATGSKN